MRRVLKDLSQNHQEPTTIFCDNNSAIELSKNHVFHKRTMHIDTRFHFIRELVNNKEICLVCVWRSLCVFRVAWLYGEGGSGSCIEENSARSLTLDHVRTVSRLLQDQRFSYVAPYRTWREAEKVVSHGGDPKHREESWRGCQPSNWNVYFLMKVDCWVWKVPFGVSHRIEANFLPK